MIYHISRYTVTVTMAVFIVVLIVKQDHVGLVVMDQMVPILDDVLSMMSVLYIPPVVNYIIMMNLLLL